MEQKIRFIKWEENASGIEIYFGTGSYAVHNPVTIEIKEWDGALSTYKSKYQKVEKTASGYQAEASVKTRFGSEFFIQDYFTEECDEVIVARNVEVVRADGHECGFSSSFFIDGGKREPLSTYDAFIPGIWYKKNENVVEKGFGSSLQDQHHYIRITRMAMPYVELYDRQNKSYLAMKHLAPVPDTGIKETGEEWLVDASFQYASMGFKAESAAELCYHFPGSEGEKSYLEGAKTWVRRSHPLREGFRHSYSFSLTGGPAEDSYEAMRKVWRYYYKKTPPLLIKADLDRVYKNSIELLNTYCQEYNGAMGIPFWAEVPEGTVCDISFQMGFVGQQTMCAYQLMKYGFEHERKELVEKAGGIIDFWVTKSVETSVIPRVWYNAFPSTFKEDYPTYTRTAADGMEGILVCCELMERYGTVKKDWIEFCIRYGDWLIHNQNKDGSFYRSYNENGEPVHTGKFNTSNVIRFLINLYWYSDNTEYKDAAIKAGEYCFENIYLPMQYVGGTADNDNTIDKEAGMIALYAFMTLFQLEQDPKWLEAAIGAADFCETWTYVWEFPVKPFKGNAIFDRRGFTGLSLIATGHSHADVMMGYMPYEFYRLYLETKDEHYLSFAEFINQNTKQTTDYTGSLHYAYPGLVEESGEFAGQYYNGLGRWLPWCSIALIESLTRLKESFGSMDIKEINTAQMQLQDHKSKIKSSWLKNGK